MNKNDIIRLEITALTSEGNGVGKAENGMAVFVPLTAVGDIIDCRIVKLQKSYAYGIIEKIIVPSGDRVSPDCPVYSKCGGCVFRHITYEAELRAKEGFVRDSFKRIGGFDIEPELIKGCDNADRYRNKSQLPVSIAEGKACFGFFSQRSHRVVAFKDCYIQPEIFSKIAARITDYIDDNRIPVYNEADGSGLVRHIYLRRGYASREIMLTLIVKKSARSFDGLAKCITDEFPEIKTVVLNINPDKTNVILGDRDIILTGDGYIRDIMCDKAVRISPHSFYQVNTKAAEEVYRTAAEYAALTGKETVLDLYCGIGTVGLSMADRAKKLIGVEVIPQAVEDAKINAACNRLDNTEFLCGDAGKISAILAKRGERPEVILLDPPRKGCDTNTLDAVLKMNPDRIVYISCNHATAARDARLLCDKGYELIKYKPMDMFPRTGHVETVVLLSKRKSYIIS